MGGDLNFISDRSGAAIKSGRDKVYQDLRNALMEPMGSDIMHPDYGSLLDGGRLPNGRVQESFLGSDSSLSIMKIKEEIGRIVQRYVDSQNIRIDNDRQTYGRTTIQDSEIIESILGIQHRMFGNKLVVKVDLLMRNSNVVSITQPIK